LIELFNQPERSGELGKPVARARIKAHEGDIVDPSIALGR
jgi:hypothetical protein